ncbi:butyrophilin-like protein 2 [Alosa alosa]|uniref:butyrophilin-like protein 2 n=1 Tax=Alosa alosa TaxID=278164 RepID=UPI00201534CB|nr:butyrophilin-like protein 2 [Alosa alosa]
MDVSVGLLVVLVKVIQGFQIQIPSSGPLGAQLGGSVLLPCSVETPLPLEELEVEWRRTDSDVLVHLFQEGEERPESQDYAYRGRAHFFTVDISQGNYSLLLSNVSREDVGIYSCKVYTEDEAHQITIDLEGVEYLVVTGTGAAAAAVGEEVVLHCSVDSHIPPEKLKEVTWKRTDNEMLVLLYQHGEVLSVSSDVQYRGRAELFPTEILKGNFSLRLKDVRTEDKGEYMCQAYSGHLSANTTVVLQGLGKTQDTEKVC